MRPGESERVVCLDGRNLALRHGTGVHTYAATMTGLLRHLGRPAGILLDSEGQAATSGRILRHARAARPFAGSAKPCTPPAPFAAGWSTPDVFRVAQVHFNIYGRLLRLRSPRPPAVMHWTYPLPMAFDGAANVTTIHDLIPLTHPHLTDIAAARFLRIISRVVERADHIVTVSEASRRDIMRLLGVPAERITNTYQPVEVPPDEGQSPPDRKGHFMFCGTLEARKNVGRLIAAYRASAAQAPLILVGQRGFRADAEFALGGADIRPLDSMPAGASHGVWHSRWLPRPDFRDLLRGARALLYPSLAEGFGLPIVEAMARGVPVLTSGAGAMAEIAGDAAVLVDPLNVTEMAGLIALLDRDTAFRARLAAAGLRRARRFTPHACQGALADVYGRLDPEFP